MSEWINSFVRKPTEADLPVWYWSTNRANPELFTDRLSTDTYYNSNHGYWKSAKGDIPKPPKTEQSQQEYDEKVYEIYFGNRNENRNYRDGLHIWNCALKHRDFQNREDLEHVIQWTKTNWNPVQESHFKALNRIRKRAGLGEAMP